MTDTKLRMALGAMWFGTRLDERSSFALLDRYVDAGGVWIDTANCYSFWADDSGSGGQSETVLGRWLAARPGVRDRIRLSTKGGCEPLIPGDFPASAEGLSKAAVKNAFEGSLHRLGTDHVELYWAHMPDPHTPLAETVEAFGELTAAARLGCSNYPVWQVGQARQLAATAGVPGWTAVQQHYTYLQPRPGTQPTVSHRFGAASDETLHYVEQHPDVELWAYTPLLSGAYTRTLAPEYDHPGTAARLAALDEVGGGRISTVLAWLTRTATPIIGVSTAAQLDEAMAGARRRLTDDEYAHLNAAT